MSDKHCQWSDSGPITISTSFELASLHARVTSIKFTAVSEWVSQWVSDKGKQWSDSGPIIRIVQILGKLWHTNIMPARESSSLQPYLYLSQLKLSGYILIYLLMRFSKAFFYICSIWRIQINISYQGGIRRSKKMGQVWFGKGSCSRDPLTLIGKGEILSHVNSRI